MSYKYDYYKKPQSVNFEKKLIPFGLPNRSGIKQKPEYIVIHEVSLGIGKSPATFNMDYYANKILQSGLEGSSIGYHYLVGDKKVYQFINDDEATHHTGTIEGNKNSIGVERVICKDINYDYALFNQAKLVATLMTKWNIPIGNVVTHKTIQSIFPNNSQNYELRIQDYTPELLKCENLFTKDDYEKIYKEIQELFSFIKDNSNDFELLEDLNISKEIKDNLIAFESLTTFDKINEISKLIAMECKLRKIISKMENKDYLPLTKKVNKLTFTEVPTRKNCPNRLIMGQRGGMEKFYRQVQYCLKHNILFTEILSDDIDFNDRLGKGR